MWTLNFEALLKFPKSLTFSEYVLWVYQWPINNSIIVYCSITSPLAAILVRSGISQVISTQVAYFALLCSMLSYDLSSVLLQVAYETKRPMQLVNEWTEINYLINEIWLVCEFISQFTFGNFNIVSKNQLCSTQISISDIRNLDTVNSRKRKWLNSHWWNARILLGNFLHWLIVIMKTSCDLWLHSLL